MARTSAAAKIPASEPVSTPRPRRVATNVAPPTKVAIDLSQPNAKKALDAAFPRPVSDRRLVATEADSAAALRYLNARDAESIASGEKEAAGNVLRYSIGDAESIEGDGWAATWKEEKAEIDWSALAKELNIPADVIERFRRPNRRVLRVREVAR